MDYSIKEYDVSIFSSIFVTYPHLSRLEILSSHIITEDHLYKT